MKARFNLKYTTDDVILKDGSATVVVRMRKPYVWWIRFCAWCRAVFCGR